MGLYNSATHYIASCSQVYEVESIATETGGTPEPRPFFEDSESNITVQLGANVYMHCRVQNLQDTLKVRSHFSSFIAGLRGVTLRILVAANALRAPVE